MPPRPASTDAYITALLALYQRAARQLRAQLRAMTLPSATQAQRRQNLATINAVLARLRAQAPHLAAAGVGRAYEVGIAIAQTPLADAAVRGELGGVHHQAVEALARSLIGSLDRANLTVGRAANDAFRQAALHGIGSTRAAGGARGEAERAIADELMRQGLTAFVDRAGRRWPLETYSHMVARTTAREAVTTATLHRLDDLGIDLVQISAHPHPRDICTPYDGQVYSLSGHDDRYPRLDRYPPFHPNCKHVMYPASQAFADVSHAIHGASSIEDVERALGLVAA